MENNNDSMTLIINLNEKRHEAKEFLDEYKKMFSHLKARVKRYEKKIALLDEEKDRYLIMNISFNVQLALNKFVLIEKYMAQGNSWLKIFDDQFKILQQSITRDQWQLKDRADRCYSQLGSFKSFLERGENEMRIANKHLKKITDHIAFLRTLNRVPQRWREVKV